MKIKKNYYIIPIGIILSIIIFFIIKFILEYVLLVNINIGKDVDSYKTFYSLENVINQYCSAIYAEDYEKLNDMTLFRGTSSKKVYKEIAETAKGEKPNLVSAKIISNNMYRCIYNYGSDDEKIITILLDQKDYSYAILYSKLV